jgi:VanZ family protein
MVFKKAAGVFFLVCLAAVTCLSLTPLTSSSPSLGWDKLNHTAAYLVLALLLDLAYRPGKKSLRKSAFLLSYSVVLELIQQGIPQRQFSGLDILANAAGLLLALVISRMLRMGGFYRIFS